MGLCSNFNVKEILVGNHFIASHIYIISALFVYFPAQGCEFFLSNIQLRHRLKWACSSSGLPGERAIARVMYACVYSRFRLTRAN